MFQVTQKFPFINSYRVFRVPSSVVVGSLVKCQLVVASFSGNSRFFAPLHADSEMSVKFFRQVLRQSKILTYYLCAADGKHVDVTGLQLPGVLDDMFAYTGPLGAIFSEDSVSLHLWAPTTQVWLLKMTHFTISSVTSGSVLFPLICKMSPIYLAGCECVVLRWSAGPALEMVQLKESNGIWSVT